MKKMLFAIIAAGLMSTSAMAAAIGTITSVTTYADGNIKVALTVEGGATYNKPLGGTAEAIKAMLAVALTAKSTGDTVTGNLTRINDVQVWEYLIIQ